MPGAHAEPGSQYSTNQQCIDYCHKPETRVPAIDGGESYTAGTVPPGQGHRTDVHGIARAIRAGASETDIARDHTAWHLLHGRGIGRTINRLRTGRNRDSTIQCIIYYGETRTGKSTAAADLYPNAYDVTTGDERTWWHAYDGQTVAIWNDFRGFMKLTKWLSMVDRWPYWVEEKGGAFLLNVIVFVFTSNVHPESWWDYTDRAAELAAVKARITELVQFSNTSLGMVRKTQNWV